MMKRLVSREMEQSKDLLLAWLEQHMKRTTYIMH